MLDRNFFDALSDHVEDHIGAPVAALDLSFRIRAVNATYEQTMRRNRSDLIGEVLFDAFPYNPDDPQANGNDKLSADFETVLSSKSAVSTVQRYDIPDGTAAGEFIPKVWLPEHMPVMDGDCVIGIVSHVCEAVDARHAVVELARILETDKEETSPDEVLHIMAAFQASVPHQAKALAAENEQLRVALESRDVLGQAKGILMERFDADAQRAWEILTKISQDSNTRVVDLARKLVDTEHPLQS
jgi:hypothetical protein